MSGAAPTNQVAYPQVNLKAIDGTIVTERATKYIKGVKEIDFSKWRYWGDISESPFLSGGESIVPRRITGASLTWPSIMLSTTTSRRQRRKELLSKSSLPSQ